MTESEASATSPDGGPTETALAGSSVAPMRRRWSGSAERASFRKQAIVWIVAIILLAASSAALLARQQAAEASRAARTDELLTQAQSDLERASSTLSTRESDLSSAMNDLEFSSPYEDSTVIDKMAAAVDFGQSLVSRAIDARERSADRYLQVQQQDTEARQAMRDWAMQWVLLVAGLFVVVVIALVVLSYVRSEKLREFENREILARVEQPPGEDGDDFRARWDMNRAQLEGYHRLVLNFSASTRQTAQISLIVGFVFLLGASGLALTSTTTPTTVAISVVATAGAVLSGFVARGVLRNLDTSSREVIAFFSHPIDVQRFLTAERIVESMDAPRRDEAKRLLIEGLTRTERRPGEPLPEGRDE